MRILLTFLLFSVCQLSGQLYETARYADDNGLPSRIVRDVAQDSQGFIWVAGNNGLFKFDGKKFKPFKAALKDTIGLRDNKINTVIAASDDKIWLGTPMGLHVLEKETVKHIKLVENPTESQEYVLSIFEDVQNRLWVGTYGGLFLLEKDGAPIHFLSEGGNSKIAQETIWGISQDHEGTIWVATNEGPYILREGQYYEFRPMAIESEEDLDLDSASFFQYRHYNDSIVLIASSIGLLKGIHKRERLVVSRFNDEEGAMPNYHIQDLEIDDEGNVWLATWKNGLKKYGWTSGGLIEKKIVPKNGFLGMSGDVKAVFKDHQDNVWAANTNGLYKFSKSKDRLLTFPPRHQENCLPNFYGIYAILEDNRSNIWVTTSTALYRFKKEDLLRGICPENYLYFEDTNMQLSRDLFIDTENRLWIGADGGLFVTQLDDDQKPSEFVRYSTADGLPHNWSFEVEQIDKNSFWVGNYHGLLKLTLPEGNLEQPNIEVFAHDNERPESLVNSQAMSIERDANGAFWIGTFSGVSRLIDDFDQGAFKGYTSAYGNFESLSNNSIKKIFNDSSGNLWIATQRGLNLYLPEEDRFLQFGHAEGLPSEYVLGIQQDSKGHLWICTTNGVLKTQFDSSSKRFVEKEYFTAQNGLVDNIPYRNSILIDENDNVFIGSRDGISIFAHRANSDIKTSNFRLALTDLESIGKKEEGFNSVYDRIVDGEIGLSHRENSIKINYAALDFLNPSFNRYRHKFLPSNETWIETGNDAELTYYNLPSGDYELILDGANSLGQWSGDPIRLQVTISPPFWKTNWALFGYMFLLFAVIVLMYRIRMRKKERDWEQKITMEAAIINEREQLRKENAADFHDELGSMLTKISMFLTMAERNLEGNEDPRPFFHKIRANTKGLSTGFRDLLWVIDPQKDSLADTFLRLKSFGEDLFEQSDIDFTTSEFQEVFTERMLNPKTKKQVVMIFKEAMNNCLKYAQAKKANLNLSANGRFSKMEFSDNGSGFDVNKKSKGRGLKNMSNRAESIGARLSMVSSAKGTTIVLDRIPHMGDEFSDK